MLCVGVAVVVIRRRPFKEKNESDDDRSSGAKSIARDRNSEWNLESSE